MPGAAFWESRWLEGHTGWDIGAASPPLTHYIDQLPPESRDWAVLIPGCGNAWEALYLLEKGFRNITLLDIAPTAVALVGQRLDSRYPDWRSKLRLVCGDFFEQKDQYDLILEQTFFCALDPSMRKDYVRQMHRLLRPGGRLAGVLFDRDFEGGPPFGGHQEEYVALFQPWFRIHVLAPCYNSIAPRAGSEVFFVVEGLRMLRG